MPSEWIKLHHWPLPARVGAIALAWLVLISILHDHYTPGRESKRIVTMGYMPVISNLAAPLLDYASREQGGIRFAAIKFSSFAELGNALRHGQIDAAFMIAPLAIVLRQQGEDVKVVYIGNRHESTMVAQASLNVARLSDLVGKTVAVPMRYSGHYLVLQKLMEEQGLSDRITVVEMNPPDMAAALMAGALDGYFVGEPFAAKTLENGAAKRVFDVEEVWPAFIGNLVLVRQQFLEKEPSAAQALVESAIRSGLWAKRNYQEAAKIAARYWNQPATLVEYAFDPAGSNRVRFDLFTPRQDEMQALADLMARYQLVTSSDISGLVEDRFAKAANLDNLGDVRSIIRAALPRSATVP